MKMMSLRHWFLETFNNMVHLIQARKHQLSITGRFALCCVVVAFSNTIERSSAHDQIPGKMPAGPVAIVGGDVYPIDSAVIRGGVVIVENGKITAVGKDKSVKIPKDAERIEAAGMNVYPGLVNAYSDIGLREIDSVQETIDRVETGRLNPNVRSWVAINPDSELIPVARAGGVLTSLVAPGGSYVAGQAAVVRMDGWTWKDMLMVGPSAMIVSWEAMEPRGDSGTDLAKQRGQRYDELDALLDAAKRYDQRRKADPDSQPIDLRLESLVAVAQGELPIIASADRRTTIEAAVLYASERKLKLVIYGGYDAGLCSDLLKREKVAVILPGTYRLPLRRDDPYDSPYTLPARLHRAGVTFCIAAEQTGYPGGASNARNLPYHAGNAVAYGLDPEVALRSVTLSAAEILGVDDSVGSLTVGKEATLIVVQGDPLLVESQVTYAMIHGRPVDLGNKHLSLFRKYQEKYRRIEQPQ
jgi:imidazolonepropionase-like amidohydrolase